MSYAYVAVFGKPWGVRSNDQVQVDAPICLLMYKGFISEVDLAAVVKPLGAGEMVSFCPTTQCTGFTWHGRVARMC